MQQLAYEKLMKDNNLSMDSLSPDALVGIKQITDIKKAMYALEKNGRSVSGATLNKIKAFDKWVCNEILDSMDDEERNDDDAAKAAAKAAAIKTEIKDVIDESEAVDPKGIKIDAELEAVFNTGKTTLTLDELKTSCKTAYDVIFDSYEPEGANGIETTYYTLLETEKQVFTITKK